MPELPGSRAVTSRPQRVGRSVAAWWRPRSAAASESSGAGSRLDRRDRQLAVQGLAGRGSRRPGRQPAFGAGVRCRCLDRAVPGAPIAAPSASPNLTPGASGVPGPGASGPAAHVHAYEPLTTQGQPTPAKPCRRRVKREHRPVRAGCPRSRSARDVPIGNATAMFASDADLASLPSTLGGAMSIIPSFRRRHSRWRTRRGAAVGTCQRGPATSSLRRRRRPRLGRRGRRLRLTPSLRQLPRRAGARRTLCQRNVRSGRGLGAANPRESYYFLDEGLSASARQRHCPMA